MQSALKANQFSWATGFPNGVAAEIELTLSAECKSKSSSLNVWFSKEKNAKLYDRGQRMTFVYTAADQFEALLQGRQRSSIEASINEIAKSGTPR